MEDIQQCLVCGNTAVLHCGQPKDHTVSHTTFSIKCCSQCGFAFTSPRPAQDTIGQYYLSADYISHASGAQDFRSRIYHTVRRIAIRNKYTLISKFKRTGHALDVGCGTGNFLAYLAQQGFHVQGVEISPIARSIATEKGLPVVPTLAHLPITYQFDLVTLWHVLEHVPDPRATLHQLFEQMSPGAVLIAAVPDRESWDCEHYGEAWAAWDVPRHLFHFRRQDLVQLLTETGFQLVGVKNMWFDAPYVSMLSEQYRGATQALALVKGVAVGMWSNLIALLQNRPTSSTMYLAQKPKNLDKAQNS